MLPNMRRSGKGKAMETVKSVVVTVDTCHYTFVQTQRRHNTESEP